MPGEISGYFVLHSEARKTGRKSQKALIPPLPLLARSWAPSHHPLPSLPAALAGLGPQGPPNTISIREKSYLYIKKKWSLK